MAMRSGKLLFGFVVAFALVFSVVFPAVQAHEGLAPAPAPASDGKSNFSSFFFSFSVYLFFALLTLVRIHDSKLINL